MVQPTLHITGAKQLKRALRELPEAMQREALEQALMESAQPMADAAKALAPVDEGRLEESIVVAKTLHKSQQAFATSSPDEVQVYVGPNLQRGAGPAGPHGHLNEFGTGPRYHETTGKYVGEMPAKPFLRPAFDATKKMVTRLLRPKLWNEIKRAAQRVRSNV